MASEPVPGIYSEDAERAVIGSVLIAPDLFTGLHSRLVSDDFFILRHRLIWDAACKIDAGGGLIDLITLGQALKDTAADIQTGYLLGLVNDTPTHTRADEYAELVKRASVRRRILEAAEKIKALASDAELSTDAVLEKANAELATITTATSGSFESMASIMDTHMADMERAMEQPGYLSGLPSVIPGFGKSFGGYQPGKMYLIAARPGMGKTSFLVCEALNMAQAGKKVAIASLEMTKSALTDSLIAVLSGVPVKAIQEKALTPAQYGEYVKAAGKIGRMPIYIEDKKMSPLQIESHARKIQYAHGLDVVIVDYIQRVKAPPGVGREEYDRVTAISIDLADMAKSLNVALIAAAQLNREADNRNDKRPQLSDLRSSGQLEQDAEVVAFPFRESYYKPTDGPSPAYEEAEIGIAKNRSGPCGIVRCAFKPALKQFAPTQTVNLNAMEGRTA
jgi:replicative DNA helicase